MDLADDAQVRKIVDGLRPHVAQIKHTPGKHTMLVVVALIAAAGGPARVSAACEVEPWGEWSSCEPKTRFSGCEYAAGAPGRRAPPVSAAVNQKATPNLRGPDNAAAVANMMLKMERQGEAMARASECEDTDNGATDRDGDGCAAYQRNPSWCGYYDDDDFSSNDMCCACKPVERGPATCEDGDADGFGCLGVDLESWTPLAQLGPSANKFSRSTNDNWGWTSAEGREWALQCADNGAGPASADGHAFRTWKRDEPQFL